MTPDLVTLVISNIPNFAGFAILALVQWMVFKRAADQYDKLLAAFLELLKDCGKTDKQVEAVANTLKR